MAACPIDYKLDKGTASYKHTKLECTDPVSTLRRVCQALSTHPTALKSCKLIR